MTQQQIDTKNTSKSVHFVNCISQKMTKSYHIHVDAKWQLKPYSRENAFFVNIALTCVDKIMLSQDTH